MPAFERRTDRQTDGRTDGQKDLCNTVSWVVLHSVGQLIFGQLSKYITPPRVKITGGVGEVYMCRKFRTKLDHRGSKWKYQITDMILRLTYSPSKATGVDKKLTCRKETVRLLRGSVLAKYNWKAIFRGHCRSIFNHCDVIGLQSYRIRWNDAK